MPCISSVSTAVGKLDIGCHVSPGAHQYKEVICEVCSSHYQAFLCRQCSSLECGPSAPSPATPSSSSVSTSLHSDFDRRVSDSSSISTQDLDSGEASSSPGVRNAKTENTAQNPAERHAAKEKERRDMEKMKFEIAQKTVEDIRGVPLDKCPKQFTTKIMILDETTKSLVDEHRNAKWYKWKADKYQRKFEELQAQVQGHNIPVIGCSDDTDPDRVRATQTDCKRRRTSQQFPTAPSGIDGLLGDTIGIDVKPRLNPRPDFRRVSYDRSQITARQ